MAFKNRFRSTGLCAFVQSRNYSIAAGFFGASWDQICKRCEGVSALGKFWGNILWPANGASFWRYALDLQGLRVDTLIKVCWVHQKVRFLLADAASSHRLVFCAKVYNPCNRSMWFCPVKKQYNCKVLRYIFETQFETLKSFVNFWQYSIIWDVLLGAIIQNAPTLSTYANCFHTLPLLSVTYTCILATHLKPDGMYTSAYWELCLFNYASRRSWMLNSRWMLDWCVFIATYSCPVSFSTIQECFWAPIYNQAPWTPHITTEFSSKPLRKSSSAQAVSNIHPHPLQQSAWMRYE